MICKTQKEAFRKVAERDDRGGYWVCAGCGKTLTNLKAHNFSHIKPKGKYPELKCDPDNIKIKCFVHHSNNDHNLRVDPKFAGWLDY